MGSSRKRAGKKKGAPAPVPFIGRWRDTGKRWRDEKGRFAAAPNQDRKRWPKPRAHKPKAAPPALPPPPKPPKLPRKLRKLRKSASDLEHPSVRRRPKSERFVFPTDLITRAGEIIGQTPDRRTLRVPWSLAEVAFRLKLPLKEILNWVERGVPSREHLSNLHALLRGARPLPPEWEHGRKRTWTREEEKKLKAGLAEFKHSSEHDPMDKYKLAITRWHDIKWAIRRRLTVAAWRKLLTKVAHAVGLTDTGAFSVERVLMS